VAAGIDNDAVEDRRLDVAGELLIPGGRVVLARGHGGNPQETARPRVPGVYYGAAVAQVRRGVRMWGLVWRMGDERLPVGWPDRSRGHSREVRSRRSISHLETAPSCNKSLLIFSVAAARLDQQPHLITQAGQLIGLQQIA
jgi:hypothetical protein